MRAPLKNPSSVLRAVPLLLFASDADAYWPVDEPLWKLWLVTIAPWSALTPILFVFWFGFWPPPARCMKVPELADWAD